MATLTGQTIAASYEQLLSLPDGGGNTDNLVVVTDGDAGTTFAMQLSTTTICIDNPTTSSSTQGGILRLQSDDGAVMASGHRLGVIEFGGAEDTSSTITVGARIEALTDATWSASENGADLVFYTTDGNASQSEGIRLGADRRLYFYDKGGEYISGNGSVLSIVGGSEIDLTATAIDVNGTFDASGAVGLASSSGVTTIGSSNGLTVSAAGVLTVNSATDASSSTSGSTIIDGGVGIAKKLYVGTDLDVEGTANLDIVDIDGAVNMAADLTSTANIIIDADDKAIVLGADQDASIFSDGAGKVKIARGSTTTIGGTEGKIFFEVRDSGDTDIQAYGGEGGAANLYLYADQGDNDADAWKMVSDTSGNLTINSYSTSSWVNHLELNASEAVFNEDSGDYDFRVESATDTHMLFIDAGNESIGIKTSTSGASSHNFGGQHCLTLGGAVQDTFAVLEIAGKEDDDDAYIGGIEFVNKDNSDAGSSTAEGVSAITTIVDVTSNNDSFNSGGHLQLWTKALNGNLQERMRINSAGDIGIGTGSSDPSARLEIDDGNATNIYIGDSTSTTYNVVSMNGTLGAGYVGIAGGASGDNNLYLNCATGGGFIFREQESTHMKLDTSGNLGIGTATPSDHYSDELVIACADEGGVTLVASATTHKQYINFADGTSGDARFMGGINYDHNTNVLALRCNGGDPFLLDANSRISLSNNDSGGTGGLNSTTGNTVFGYLAGQSIDSGSVNNTFIGHGVSDATMNDAIQNVGIGAGALTDLTEGDYNICIGTNAGANITTGDENVAIGDSALLNATTTNLCVAIGSGAGDAISTAAAGSTLIGSYAGSAITDGAYNTAVGYNALLTNTQGDKIVAIGYEAGKVYNPTADYGNSVFIGHQAGLATTTARKATVVGDLAVSVGVMTGHENTVVGHFAGADLTSATGSTLLGTEAGANVTTGEYNTFVGTQSGDALTIGIRNTAVGRNALGTTVDVDQVVAIGYNAIGSAQLTVGASNADGTVGIGYNVMESLTSGTGNVAVGFEAGKALTTQSYNTFIGHEAGESVAGASNTALGYRALADASADVDYCVAIGHNALTSADADYDSGSVAIGHQSLQNQSATALAGNTAIGHQSGAAITTGARNTVLGYKALDAADGAESDNIAIGVDALGNLDHDSASKNIAIGSYAGDGMGAFANAMNIFIGHDAGGGTWDTARSQYNIGIGAYALDGAMDDANSNIAIGVEALSGIIHGDNNIGIGHDAGNDITDGHSNTLLGNYTGDAISTGIANTFIGYASGGTTTATNYCVALGYEAMNASNVEAGANHTIAIGTNSLNAITSASGCVAIGYQAAQDLTTGTATVAIGKNAAANITTGQNNVIIGQDALATADGDENSNVAIGKQAMGSCSHDSVSSNVAIGTEALYGGGNIVRGNVAIGKGTLDGTGSNIIDYCVAIGWGALGGSLTNNNSYQVAVGYNALEYLTSGTYNTVVGSEAMKDMTTGDNNTALGYKAGYAIAAGNNPDGNTFIGYRAGDSVTTGSYNTMIGINTDTNAVGDSNETAIGNGATGAGSNTVTLGNADVTAYYLQGNSGTDLYLGCANNTETTSNRIFFHKADNNLDDPDVVVDDELIGGIFAYGHDGNSYESAASIIFDVDGGASDGDMPGRIEFHTTPADAVSLSERMRITEAGNVGIGVADPDNRLDVAVANNGFVAQFFNDGATVNRQGILIQCGQDNGSESGTNIFCEARTGDGTNTGQLKSVSGTFQLADASDSRLKEDIVDTSIKGIESVNAMKVRDYKWKNSDIDVIGGFVAQELKEVFAPAVDGEDGAMEDWIVKATHYESGDDIPEGKNIGDEKTAREVRNQIKPMTVSRERLVPVLVKAIQELSAKVEELEAKLK